MQINRRSFLKSGAAVLATGAVTGCATATRTNPAALRGNADALLRNAVAWGEGAGVVAAATTREGTFYETAFGERVLGQGPAMSLDTVCWIASMTKPLVGAGVMQLVEQGRLDLDAPAGKVIPYLGEVQVLDGWDDKGEARLRSAKAPVTLRNLLTHTSGFVYDIWDADIARYTMTKDPEVEPGGGGIYSTAGDYLRFARMILNGGVGNGNRVLRAETVARMSRNNIGNLRVGMLKTQNAVLSRDAEFFIGAPKTWGLTFMINEEQAANGRSAGSLAWAGLANTYMWIDPQRGVAGVYLTQILPFVDEKSFPLYLAFQKAGDQSLG